MRTTTCENCQHHPPTNTHHRKPRQQGGTKNPHTHNPTNTLKLCGSGTTGCHGLIESQRTLAYQYGLLVHQWDDPAQTPLLIGGKWALLTEDNTYWWLGLRLDLPNPKIWVALTRRTVGGCGTYG